MGTAYATVTLRAFNGSDRTYTERFLVDTGVIDCVVPTGRLIELGVKVVGQELYELADGRRITFDFGFVQIEILGKKTAGRVVFGPEEAEPILGVVALESAVLRVNPVTQELEKLPSSILK